MGFTAQAKQAGRTHDLIDWAIGKLGEDETPQATAIKEISYADMLAYLSARDCKVIQRIARSTGDWIEFHTDIRGKTYRVLLDHKVQTGGAILTVLLIAEADPVLETLNLSPLARGPAPYWLLLGAVFLAWPTVGLSLLAWFGWLVWLRVRADRDAKTRKAISGKLKVLMDGHHIEYAGGLMLPYTEGVAYEARTAAQLEAMGRIIQRFLVQNPKEADKFIAAVEAQCGCDGDLCVSPPTEALMYEDDREPLVQLVSYRAVEALMTHNSLPCFQTVDLAAVSEHVTEIEQRLKDRAASLREDARYDRQRARARKKQA